MQSSQRLYSCSYAGASWWHLAVSPQVLMPSLYCKGKFFPSFQSCHCLGCAVWDSSVSPFRGGWWPGVRQRLFVPVQKQVTVVNHPDSFRCKWFLLSLYVLIFSVTSTGRYVGGKTCWLQSFKLLTKSRIRKLCGCRGEKLLEAGIDL